MTIRSKASRHTQHRRKDIARGFTMMCSTAAGVGTVTNFGSNFGIPIGQTVEAIEAAIDSPIDVEVDQDRLRPHRSEVDRLWADNARARQLIGWTPEYGGRDGFGRSIAETVEWFADPKNRDRHTSDRCAVWL